MKRTQNARPHDSVAPPALQEMLGNLTPPAKRACKNASPTDAAASVNLRWMMPEGGALILLGSVGFGPERHYLWKTGFAGIGKNKKRLPGRARQARAGKPYPAEYSGYLILARPPAT